MSQFHTIGKMLLVVGVLIVALGLLLMFFDRIPLLGKLPGDIIIRRKNFTLFFPLATSIILSLLLTLILYLLRK